MMRFRQIMPLVVACLVSGDAAFGTSESTQDAAGGDQRIVARVGDETITAAEFAEEMVRRGGGRRGQYTSSDQRRALLAEMIRERLVIAEARRLGLEQSREVQEALRRLLITQLSREKLQPMLEQVTVTDAEVEAEFRANRDLYRTPERLRGAIVQFDKPSPAPAEKLDELRAKVEALREQALDLGPDVAGFGEIARSHSTDRGTRYLGGVLPWLYRGRDYKWGTEVTDALFALESPGDVGPVVETDSKLFLVRLVERETSRQLELERYAAGIRNQLLERKRQSLREQFYRQLEETHPVQTDVGVLSTLPSPPVTTESSKTLPPSPTDTRPPGGAQ